MFDPERLRQRREDIARRWRDLRGPVVVPSGLLVPIAGTDQFHDYHAHNEHYYLSGNDQPGSVVAYDPREGWTLFAPVASQEDRVWIGDSIDFETLRERSGIEQVRPIAALSGWLEQRRGEPLALLGNPDLVGNPGGYGLENWAALEVEVDDEVSHRLSEAISEARRTKDEGELALMRQAAAASREGHLAGLRLARPGMTERQLQVEIEVEFFRNGAARTAYGSIVGTGPNGAVLHFAPTNRPLQDGDIVLVDAGAEIGGYASDVTRTFPVAPRFDGFQRDLYQLVLNVQEQAIRDARPGKEYKELHLEASAGIAAGLADLGILRGRPADLVERDAHALFFPHGLGHMLGLATHDAGGCLAGRTPSDRFGLKWLRADLPLRPGYVVTIEPGIYFIRAILEDPAHREAFGEMVNWDRVDRLLDFGGIRIEDDILVTDGAAEVLSADIPKQIDEIEVLRQEAAAP